MKYKLIVSDIDGTLLNNQQYISKKTIKSIREAEKSGLLFTLATGRNHINTIRIAKKIKIKLPIISNDGALVIDLASNKILREERIPDKTAKGILKILDKYNLGCSIHLFNRTILTKKFKMNLKKMKKIFKLNFKIFLTFFYLNQEKKSFKLMSKEDILLFMEDNNDYPFKFTIFDGNSSTEIFEQAISEISNLYGEDIEITMVSNMGFEIIPKAVSKASGLKYLCRKLEVYPDEIIAFGDNYNDASMIKFSGLGIAMGNAKENIKFIADIITDSNDLNGIAKVINKFILNK